MNTKITCQLVIQTWEPHCFKHAGATPPFCSFSDFSGHQKLGSAANHTARVGHDF